MKNQPTIEAEIEAVACSGMSPGATHFQLRSSLRVHRLYVNDKSDDGVTVLSIQRGAYASADNLLLMPVKLLYLNNVLQWFQWTGPDRMEGLVLGIDHPGPLMMSVTREAPVDWVGRDSDEAYASWFRENPDGDVEQWLAYLGDRIRNGLAGCGMNQCFDRAAAGSAWCHEHTKHMEQMNKLQTTSSNPK